MVTGNEIISVITSLSEAKEVVDEISMVVRAINAHDYKLNPADSHKTADIPKLKELMNCLLNELKWNNE